MQIKREESEESYQLNEKSVASLNLKKSCELNEKRVVVLTLKYHAN